MGQTVYVLMMLEGGKKGKEWRPAAVVTNPDVAAQWYEYGRDVDWVPLELDDVKNISPENMPSFHPREVSPNEERMQQMNEQLQGMVTRLETIVKKQEARIKALTKQGAAETVPPKPQGFADVLNDAKEIADYIETYAPYEVDNEFVYEQYRGTHAVLKLVPLADLREGGRDHNLRSKKNEDKYLKQDLKTQPPALVENGEVVDGNHRFRANKRRGLTAMWCYVVMEGKHGNTDTSSDQEG